MTKRAKLNLVTDIKDAEKRTAFPDSDVENSATGADAEPVTQDQDESVAGPSASTKSTNKKPTEPRQDPEGITPSLKGKILLKAVIVVGVTVATLAVYLYKRRLLR